MNPHIAEQLLYDSEATLRLVDTLLDELQVMEPEDSVHDGGPALQLHAFRGDDDVSQLPHLLLTAATRARTALGRLARDRASAADHLSDGNELDDGGTDLDATIEIREGLERALMLVDRLDARR